MPLNTEDESFKVRSFLLDVENSELHVSYAEYETDGAFKATKLGTISGENYQTMVMKNPTLYAQLKSAVYAEVAVLEELAKPSEVI